MKIKLLFTLIILLTINLVSAQSFRTLFKESFALLEQDNYEKALPILLEMHDLQPNNANISNNPSVAKTGSGEGLALNPV